jgi:hypothetical protein
MRNLEMKPMAVRVGLGGELVYSKGVWEADLEQSRVRTGACNDSGIASENLDSPMCVGAWGGRGLRFVQ